MMCTGAILSAGLNVVSLCFDDRAGVNYAKDFKFGTLPAALQRKQSARLVISVNLTRAVKIPASLRSSLVSKGFMLMQQTPG
jgi:hypothetical protein